MGSFGGRCSVMVGSCKVPHPGLKKWCADVLDLTLQNFENRSLKGGDSKYLARIPVCLEDAESALERYAQTFLPESWTN